MSPRSAENYGTFFFPFCFLELSLGNNTAIPLHIFPCNADSLREVVDSHIGKIYEKEEPYSLDSLPQTPGSGSTILSHPFVSLPH